MAQLKFQNPEGNVITIDSPDGSMPNEQELDQLFAMAGNKKPEQPVRTKPSIVSQLGQSFKNIGVGLVRGIAEPIVKNVLGRPLQGLESLISGQQPVPFDFPFPKSLGGDIPITPLQNLSQAVGAGAQTASLGLSPTIGGLMYGAGNALEAGKGPGQATLEGLAGAGLGKITGMVAGEPLLTGKVGQFIRDKMQPALKESSARIVNSLIKPLLKDFSYGKNPGLAIAQEGIVANNFDDLAQKISLARQNKGQMIIKTLENPKYKKVKFNIVDDLKPIDEAMETAATQNNQTLINRLQETKRAITQNLVLGKDKGGNPIIQSLGDKNLSSLTPVEATKIKSGIGDLTKWTGNVSDDKLVNKALKQSYGKIKERIGNAIPEIKTLNESYANLTSAEIATKYRDKIMQRQNLVGLVPKIASMAEALTFLATGNPHRLIEGIAIIGVDKIMSSPALKTRLASGLSKLSESDLLKVGKTYPLIMTLIKKGKKF